MREKECVREERGGKMRVCEGREDESEREGGGRVGEERGGEGGEGDERGGRMRESV